MNFCRVVFAANSQHSKNSKKHNFPDINFMMKRDFIVRVLFYACALYLYDLRWQFSALFVNDVINNYCHCVFVLFVPLAV